MTENEAIKEFNKMVGQRMRTNKGISEKQHELFQIAMDSLKEVQQYREIGTIDDFKTLDYLRKRYEDKTYDFCGEYGTEECGARAQIERLKEYEAIGTVDECRKAMDGA